MNQARIPSIKVNDVCTYTIRLRGGISESEINALLPLRLSAAAPVGPGATTFTLRADQSGLIGLMRALHGLGFVLLEVRREELPSE